MVVVVRNRRVVALLDKLTYFRCCHTEDESVVITYYLVYLNVCAVKSTECDSAVYHKLHVACTGSLCACKRYLLAYLSGRNELFCDRYAVVLKIYDFKTLVYTRVIVYLVCKSNDELYYFLCKSVARSCLCAEDVCLWLIFCIWVISEPLISAVYMESVEKLTLVLVQTLYLYIKDGICINDYTVVSLDVFSHTSFVFLFDLGKLFKYGCIILVSHKTFKRIGILYELVAYKLGYEICKTGV